jgi:hypothetical protein
MSERILSGNPVDPLAAVPKQYVDAAIAGVSAGSGAMTLITSSVLASATPSVVFSAIPATYNHLRLVANGRSSTAAESDRWQVTINTISTGYDWENTAAGQELNAVAWFASTLDLPAASATSGVPGVLILDLPCYAQTTFDKMCRWHSGYIDGANSDAILSEAVGCVRSSTAAITSLTISTHLTANFIVGSSFYLYGIT